VSSSEHPIALRIERRVGRGPRLLASVMALPLLDGVFPALVLAGALAEPLGVVKVGLLVFGGSATIAVVLADLDGPRRQVASSVLAVGLAVTALAALEAALAPTLASALVLPTFERFAALILVAVAARTASATVADYLPGPGVVLALGLVASVDPSRFRLDVVADPQLVAAAAAAGLVGTALALATALAGPHLRRMVDLDRFRFGSAVALAVLPLSLFGVTDVPVSLMVLAVAALLALDPRAEPGTGTDEEPSGEDETSATDRESDADDAHTGRNRAPWF
jgi:hypothetical protein